MPLGLRFQPSLAFVPGLGDSAQADEVLMVCRKAAAGGWSPVVSEC
jgi:hypothetical protein